MQPKKLCFSCSGADSASCCSHPQAHECGHQAFSESQAVNDAVGLILHSCLLVPYYSWWVAGEENQKNRGDLPLVVRFVLPSSLVLCLYCFRLP